MKKLFGIILLSVMQMAYSSDNSPSFLSFLLGNSSSSSSSRTQASIHISQGQLPNDFKFTRKTGVEEGAGAPRTSFMSHLQRYDAQRDLMNSSQAIPRSQRDVLSQRDLVALASSNVRSGIIFSDHNVTISTNDAHTTVEVDETGRNIVINLSNTPSNK